MKRILFISHDASVAGAQLFLIQFLRFLKTNPGFEFEILSKNDGPLVKEFREFAKVTIWQRYHPEQPALKFIHSLFLKVQHSLLLFRLKKRKFDLVYSNTITNGNVLHALSSLGIPVITHVHELNYWIEMSGEENLSSTRENTDKFIAGSDATRRNLINQWNIPEEKIELIYEFIDCEREIQLQKPGKLKTLLGVESGCMIVGACGSDNWRKGRDLFIPIAVQTLKAAPDHVHFVWVGGKKTWEESYDLDKSGFGDRIHFIDHIHNAGELFIDFDLFILPSRDDTFPLVNLIAGVLGKPVMCFKDSGGAPELLRDQPEMILPYLNVNEMSSLIQQLICHDSQRVTKGEQLKDYILHHFDIRIIGPRLTEAIITLLPQ